jgi:hypothetical protein
MAPGAREGAAFHEHGGPDARTVVNCKFPDIEYDAVDIISLLRFLKKTPHRPTPGKHGGRKYTEKTFS